MTVMIINKGNKSCIDILVAFLWACITDFHCLENGMYKHVDSLWNQLQIVSLAWESWWIDWVVLGYSVFPSVRVQWIEEGHLGEFKFAGWSTNKWARSVCGGDKKRQEAIKSLRMCSEKSFPRVFFQPGEQFGHLWKTVRTMGPA